MERIESAHSLWLFDTERKRFRRLPRGVDPDSLALDADWEPYHALEIDDATGAFTVVLDEAGTRLLRAFRAASAPSNDRPPDATTTELRIPDQGA